MAIKAIILDLEGVIMITKENDLSMMIAKKLDAPYEKVYEIFYGEMNDRIDLGEITQGEFNAYVVDALQISKDKITLLDQAINEDLFIDTVFMEKIAGLRGRYKIGLLSNYSDDLRGMIEHKWKISGAFDEIIISCEVGLLKPDPAIFNLMLDRLGTRAEEAVFVDDRMRNIEGAKKVGMQTVFYETREQALGELERILEA